MEFGAQVPERRDGRVEEGQLSRKVARRGREWGSGASSERNIVEDATRNGGAVEALKESEPEVAGKLGTSASEPGLVISPYFQSVSKNAPRKVREHAHSSPESANGSCEGDSALQLVGTSWFERHRSMSSRCHILN